MKERKHEAPPRYDAAFKEGAIRLVVEEGRPMREVAEELGVCTDTIRNWLKASGIQPKETERQNRLERRQRDLEAEIRSLRKQLAQKDVVLRGITLNAKNANDDHTSHPLGKGGVKNGSYLHRDDLLKNVIYLIDSCICFFTVLCYDRTRRKSACF